MNTGLEHIFGFSVANTPPPWQHHMHRNPPQKKKKKFKGKSTQNPQALSKQRVEKGELKEKRVSKGQRKIKRERERESKK